MFGTQPYETPTLWKDGVPLLLAYFVVDLEMHAVVGCHRYEGGIQRVILRVVIEFIGFWK